MVWGCFFYYEFERLTIYDGTVNRKNYKNILEENLVHSIEGHFSFENGVFLRTSQYFAIE